VIPARDLGLIIDNIGLPQRVYNLAFTDGSTIGVNDGQILISLKEGHAPTADYVKKLRVALTQAYPDLLLYFQPADMVTQILNFGVASQIDLQVQGRDREGNGALVRELTKRMRRIPGLVDVHLQQELDAPEFYYKVDRARAQQLGLNVQSVVNNVNISLSSSEQVSPNFWTDTAQGIPYYLAVQTPEYLISSVNELDNTPISALTTDGVPITTVLGNVARMRLRPVQSVYSQSNIQPVLDIYASVQDSDLGSVAASLDKLLGELRSKLKPGNYFVVHGQVQSMNAAFDNLVLGLIFAAVFVYLLMVVNFQRSRIRELDPAGRLRPRPAPGGPQRPGGRPQRRADPNPSGADDGGRHARRHAPHGYRRSRRGAECGARPRRHRRRAGGNADDAFLRALSLRDRRPLRAPPGSGRRSCP